MDDLTPQLKELLIFAARATGLEIRFSKAWHNEGCPEIKRPNVRGAMWRSWYIRECNEEAFDIACDLRLIVRFFDHQIVVDGGGISVSEPCSDENRKSAARLAILRAAAEIGKTMQGA